MTLRASSSLDGVTAVSRFGLGAKPGELALASTDPRGWLKAQIVRSGAEQPVGRLATARDRFDTYRAVLAQVRTAKANAAPLPASPVAGPALDGDASAAAQIKAQRQALLAPLRDGVRDEIMARTQLASATDAPFRER